MIDPSVLASSLFSWRGGPTATCPARSRRLQSSMLKAVPESKNSLPPTLHFGFSNQHRPLELRTRTLSNRGWHSRTVNKTATVHALHVTRLGSLTYSCSLAPMQVLLDNPKCG